MISSGPLYDLRRSHHYTTRLVLHLQAQSSPNVGTAGVLQLIKSIFSPHPADPNSYRAVPPMPEDTRET